MAHVLSMLSTSFWLVPDRSLVQPGIRRDHPLDQR